MRNTRTSAFWVGVCLVVAGCQGPGAMRRGGYSASEHSGAFASDSGDSSAGSGDSSAGSGNSSAGSGNSSNDSGNSSAGSGDSSNDSGNSSNDSGNSSANSGNSSENSSENSSNESSKNSTEGTSDSSGTSGEKKNPLSSATVVGLTAAGLGAVFWQAASHAMRGPPPVSEPPPGAEPPPDSGPPPAPEEVARAAQTYLRSRTYQLREDLALGAGPTIEELAAMARIRREHLPIFGRLLRAHRQELLAMAEVRALTPWRAVEWMRRVGEIASTDPRLEEDRRAFLTAYEAEVSRP